MSSRRSLALALSLAVAGCAPAASPPAPAPRVVAPSSRPVAPPPLASDWRDWPVTPGDWRYSREANISVARFGPPGGTPLLALHCETITRQIWLARPGTAATQLTVRTSSALRTLTAQPVGEGQIAAALPAADPLLDAMGFSRGRFVIEQAGRPPLVIPAWAEILRVAEDCRQ